MSVEILGVGAPVIDRIIQVDDSFLMDLDIVKGGMKIVDHSTLEKIENSSPLNSHPVTGGSTANTIKGLAHLGYSCALVGKIGTDFSGHEFLQVLSRLHIKSYYARTPTRTGQILSLVTPDKERTFCSFLGSGKELVPSELWPAFFSGTKLVHIEGYTLLNPGVTERAMRLANQAQSKVSFDLASFELVKDCKVEVSHLISRYVDILFANAAEAMALTGLEPEKACASLQGMCGTVVVFMGAHGCWVGQGEQRWFIPGIKVAAADTTGAGDLFASGFLHGYLKECPADVCAHYGTLVASEVVQVFGAELPKETWINLMKKI